MSYVQLLFTVYVLRVAEGLCICRLRRYLAKLKSLLGKKTLGIRTVDFSLYLFFSVLFLRALFVLIYNRLGKWSLNVYELVEKLFLYRVIVIGSDKLRFSGTSVIEDLGVKVD